MEHVILSDGWNYVEDPFPCYKIKKYPPDRETDLIILDDIVPEEYFEVTKSDGMRLYYGTDKHIARDVKKIYDMSVASDSYMKSVIIKTIPILKKNEFEIRKITGSNILHIRRADNVTNDCLLFFGCFGSMTSLDNRHTTAKILATYKREELFNPNSIEIIAVLKEGQCIVFDVIGRDSSCFRHLMWDGKVITQSYQQK